MKKSMIAFVVVCAVAIVGIAERTPAFDSITNKIAEAFVPSNSQGTMDDAKVFSVMSLVRSSQQSVRYSLESNIICRIMSYPTPYDKSNFLWIWKQKEHFLGESRTLGYWHTNKIAILEFADHLGANVNVSTNSFLYEYMIASIDDVMEEEIERAECKLQGKPFSLSPVSPSRNLLRVKRRQQCANAWNQRVRYYRRHVMISLSRRIKEYLDILAPDERRRFMDEFASRARLSNEEKKLAFGDYAE